MGYLDTIKTAFKASTFDEPSAIALSNNEGGTGQGFLTLALTGFLNAAIPMIFFAMTGSALLMTLGMGMLIMGPIMMIVGFIIGYSIYHFLAKFLFKGQATGVQYFRTLSALFVLYWIAIVLGLIPYAGQYLSLLFGVWLFALNIYVLMKVHKLNVTAAVIVGFIPLIIALAILFVVGVNLPGLN